MGNTHVLDKPSSMGKQLSKNGFTSCAIGWSKEDEKEIRLVITSYLTPIFHQPVVPEGWPLYSLMLKYVLF